MKVDLYSQTGEKKGEVDLKKEIFEVPFNEDLVHQALVYQLSNARRVIAHTKSRGEVRGGGAKPFKQKGTGRARQGSKRNVHMRGGCVVFGPSNERNFKKQMPKKQRRKALFCALSEKARNKEIIALDKYEGEIKTKPLQALIGKLPIKRDALIVVPGRDKSVELSARNLPNVKTIHANYINIKDLQKYDTVLFMQDSLAKLEEVFLNTK
ncbi:50S ribosomal protein L4 [Candidatus Peregrinibacteria bacterium]|jgi:large subunit ribosomal protein L4|nr:50S ribosomal protein L4 [Candidatus Peregrinibacteria bacterium]MBT4147774.1 50S ribosomal protein L4 [Candidatus Peregrinibacteria bacterium]MBT4365915.1 50S ribosomal protein L4 [Candidatus Peregrinibacteria bacterium]MBT4456540.1 50S ribosomal protein L4 [Candidatus Peregrinibacteria bacterium]